MSITFTHQTMLSPFSWRYGSTAMRHIWSEHHKRLLWRRIWVALAEAQHEAGLVTAAQVAELRAHAEQIDLDRSLQIEAEIQHDLMAEVRCFAEQCPVAGGIIHLGATSMDIEDNATALQLREAFDLLIAALRTILDLLGTLIEREADHLCIAFTHLQPAAPTTIGYRLAGYGQDLLAVWHHFHTLRGEIRGKGFKGAVGTSASYEHLLAGSHMSASSLESIALATLGLEAYPIASQTYPRRQDYLVVSALADLALVLHKFAFDVRLLQMPNIGEWAEPFGAQQVGSSAMPFKRNPIHAENIGSLARYLAALPAVAWDNAAGSLLERTLDDSANRRIILPEAFLAAEEILRRGSRVLAALRIDEAGVRRNLDQYATFAASERLLMECAREGGDRQSLHEVIREHSMTAWAAVQAGQPNPLVRLLAADTRITHYLPASRVEAVMRVEGFVGDAPQRARALATALKQAVARDSRPAHDP